MDKHFVFIDDSGSKNWETPYSKDFVKNSPSREEENLNFWRRNYFILACIHIAKKDIKDLNPFINKLKVKYFKTKHVEIKSSWLRNPHKRKKHYLNKFDINLEKLRSFVSEWYKIFKDNEKQIQIQAFVLDKRFYKNKRENYSPLQILTQVLFDRIELHPAKNCLLVFDQMERQIKSESGRQGDILKISDKEIDLGSFHEEYSHARPVFEKSSNSSFLQLADTAAYNVFRQFVHHGNEWENNSKKAPKTYNYFKKILPNFYEKDGRINGVGIVKAPDLEKVDMNWDK